MFASRCGIVLALFPVVVGVVAAATCDSKSPVGPPPAELASGTWGGDRAGVIVNDSVAHVHIGCTYGDFPAPIALDADGRFSLAGQYLLRAYPVAVGPPLPAQFAGVLRGRELVLTVAVNDTIEKKLVVLGPVTVVFGREPSMGPCPICEDPAERGAGRVEGSSRAKHAASFAVLAGRPWAFDTGWPDRLPIVQGVPSGELESDGAGLDIDAEWAGAPLTIVTGDGNARPGRSNTMKE